MSISSQRRSDIIDALRRGTVPQYGLDALAVGLKGFETAFDEELEKVARGSSQFKAIRGEYGSGKTFISRWLRERAHRLGFACAVAKPYVRRRDGLRRARPVRTWRQKC